MHREPLLCALLVRSLSARCARVTALVHREPLLCALLVALVLLGSAPSAARATVLSRVPLDDMILDADAIVLGEVVRVGTRVVVGAGRVEPWTVTTLRVERWLAGAGGEAMAIEERGGVWQGGGMRIAGTPRYRVGERVLVFLWRDPLGRLRTYGMVQGKFVVRAGIGGLSTTVQRDLDGVAFASWANGRMSLAPGSTPPLRLDAILARIGRVRSPAGRLPPGGVLSGRGLAP